METEVNTYETFIQTYSPTCKSCNDPLTIRKFRRADYFVRHLDCSVHEIGTCVCGPTKHTPEFAQFFCGEKCFLSHKKLIQDLQETYKRLRFREHQYEDARKIKRYLDSLDTPYYRDSEALYFYAKFF